MKVFILMGGNVDQGYNSASRGETRWANNLIRCLSAAGHKVTCMIDYGVGKWGNCPTNENIRFYPNASDRKYITKERFAVAIYTNWQANKACRNGIIADKHLYGIMGWKDELMKNGYFDDDEYVIRWFRSDVDKIPYPINFRHKCFLLAQPFGNVLGGNKFLQKRVGWVAKEAFFCARSETLNKQALLHLEAAVDACNLVEAPLRIFSAEELTREDPVNPSRINEYGIDKILKRCKKLELINKTSYVDYTRKLQECSITIPINLAGSVVESIFHGIVPLIYHDSMFADHPYAKKAIRVMTDEMSWAKVTYDQIFNFLFRFLGDIAAYNYYLHSMRTIAIDSIDNNVVKQFEAIAEGRHDSEN